MSAPSPGWVLLPAIAAVGGHVGLCALLLAKWQALEQEVSGGHPLVFANVSAALPDSVNPVGPHWAVVFVPSWIGEAVVMTTAAAALAIRANERRNSRLLHANSICQAAMNCLFLGCLLRRLESDAGSWLLVFAPVYAAVAMQAAIHYQKTPDRRNRRPGFPIGIPHLLAIVVSAQLAGVFAYEKSSWANVLWPLWGLGGFLAGSLLLGVCCGLPLLLRRDMQVPRPPPASSRASRAALEAALGTRGPPLARLHPLNRQTALLPRSRCPSSCSPASRSSSPSSSPACSPPCG